MSRRYSSERCSSGNYQGKVTQKRRWESGSGACASAEEATGYAMSTVVQNWVVRGRERMVEVDTMVEMGTERWGGYKRSTFPAFFLLYHVIKDTFLLKTKVKEMMFSLSSLSKKRKDMLDVLLCPKPPSSFFAGPQLLSKLR